MVGIVSSGEGYLVVTFGVGGVGPLTGAKKFSSGSNSSSSPRNSSPSPRAASAWKSTIEPATSRTSARSGAMLQGSSCNERLSRSS